ncbi:MAG: hypothetical protein OXE85_00940, partial [Roseovarius sp.]|nr:hypothetical protein [Roseovarius sp.]
TSETRLYCSWAGTSRCLKSGAFRSQGIDVGNPAANIPGFEDENDINLLRQMYEIYGQHTARQLSDLTCEGGALHVAMGDWRSFHSHPG